MEDYGRFSRPEWDFLLHDDSEHAKRYRDDLADCLEGYPEDDRKDLEGRMHDGTASGFRSACLELRSFRLLRSYGPVEVHPQIVDEEKHPDFKVDTREGDVFVEAVIALDSDEERSQQQKFGRLLDSIDRLGLPIRVWVEPTRIVQPALNNAVVVAFLRKQLVALDPNEIAKGTVVTYRDQTEQGAVEVDFEVWPKEEAEAEGMVAAWGARTAHAVTTHLQIRRKVRHKACRYGELGAPFVLAIWPMRDLLPIEETVFTGFYGDRQVGLLRSGGIEELPRLHNGAFTTLFEGQILNREVSAACVYLERLVAHGWERHWVIYHNPFALIPLPPRLFDSIPQYMFKHGQTGFDGKWADEVNPWESMFR